MNWRILIGILCAVSSLWSGLLSVPNERPRVKYGWNAVLDSVWQGIKQRNIDAWNTGLVHRPKSEMPGDAVSEGVGYGMLVALFAGDQEYFNRIWDAGERYLWNGKYYDWRANSSGTVIGRGAATDADEDIALALIFADRLVRDSIWKAHVSPRGVNYAQRAQTILNSMWSERMISSNYNLAPGAGWGGDDFVNPGYFAPAWYRIFKEFDENANHQWDLVIEQCYTVLERNPGAALGLAPDWMTPSGAFYNGSLGYNPYFNGRAMHKDGIRVLWRLAVDAIWFDAQPAKNFLRKSMDFIRSKGGASASNFYDMEGNLHPQGDVFVFNGGKSTRPRREHSHLTIGMWATAAMAVGSEAERESFSQALAGFYEPKARYFGLSVDPSGNAEDTAHNEMYFDQFLAWFGASLLAGVFSNILYDLDHPPVRLDIGNRDRKPEFKMQNHNLYIRGMTAQVAEIWSLRGTRLMTIPCVGGECCASLEGFPSGVFVVRTGETSRRIFFGY